jgi:23S rRNA (cytosine1962-C5)-methyltransferase
MTLRIHLKKGREVPILRGHPWIMSGAIAHLEGDKQEDEADIVTADGVLLGRATVHPPSEIRARLFSTVAGECLDAAGLRVRLTQAAGRRRRWLPEAEALRVVSSESDGLPGLIVDRYGAVLVMQILTAPMDRRRETILAILQDLFHPQAIWERSDVDVRRHEGLEPRKGLAAGTAPPFPLPFRDGDWTFLADIENGHKTGFYLDQRESRLRVAAWVKRLGAPRVLNVFAYTDSFGVVALKSGAASVLALDSSSAARDLAERQHALNGTADPARREYRLADAFETLRGLREKGEFFDMVIVDPPRLVSGRQRLHAGLRAYKDINMLALQVLKPEGVLMTFSCSGLVDRELFGKVLEGAARDAHRPVCIVESLGQPPDHPRKPGFPESEYLKGCVLAG